MDSLRCAGFDFFNNFDSANLAKVEHVPLEECCKLFLHNSTRSVFIILSFIFVAFNDPSTNSSKTIVADPIEAEFNIWTKPDCCGTEFENANRTWFYFGMRGKQ